MRALLRAQKDWGAPGETRRQGLPLAMSYLQIPLQDPGSSFLLSYSRWLPSAERTGHHPWAARDFPAPDGEPGRGRCLCGWGSRLSRQPCSSGLQPAISTCSSTHRLVRAGPGAWGPGPAPGFFAVPVSEQGASGAQPGLGLQGAQAAGSPADLLRAGHLSTELTHMCCFRNGFQPHVPGNVNKAKHGSLWRKD